MPTPTEQLLSRTIYDTDGVTTNWNFSFSSGYIDVSHVKAYTEDTNGIRTNITVTPGMLIGQFQLQITPALAAGKVLTIYRDTPKDATLVDFTDESGFSEVALDTNAKQAVFVAAEIADLVNTTDVAAAISASEAALAAAATINSQTAASLANANAASASAGAAASSAASAAAGVVSGNLTFTGTGNRITGDFSNATLASRVMVQTSTANSASVVGVIPNGTSTDCALVAYNAAIPINSSTASMYANAAEIRFSSDKAGTGSYLPMTFYTGGSEKMRIDSVGNVTLSSATGSLGYGTGAGGTVTQTTSKSTSVALNKPTGKITTNNAALAANTQIVFVLSNSLISANDVVQVCCGSNSGGNVGTYQAWVGYTQAGACYIVLRNTSVSSFSDAVDINFAVIKGATA